MEKPEQNVWPIQYQKLFTCRDVDATVEADGVTLKGVGTFSGWFVLVFPFSSTSHFQFLAFHIGDNVLWPYFQVRNSHGIISLFK